MDRKEKIDKFYNISLNLKLRELMEILAPGEKSYWGGKKHDDLVAYSACHLAAEYQALTGYPVVDMLTDKRDIDDPTPSISDVTTPAVHPPPPAPPQSDSPSTEDALPL